MKDLHLLLPDEVYERLEVESKRDLIPVSHLARRCVLREYGGGSVVSSDYRNHVDTARTMQVSQPSPVTPSASDARQHLTEDGA